ncbi:hypothetical protein G5714_015807 [Onychostoma macrolepis]|uniref:Uncharacterized protein n=1 Tax=Onychostoma macrolepis TaxID=369639 RepID=A0A7J6C7B0_9TELE|nr:hypothetical protein G5714_015807 [Onychostoma macrolepis]
MAHGQVCMCRASPLHAVFGSRGGGDDGRRAEVRGWDSSGGVREERMSSGTGERREGRKESVQRWFPEELVRYPSRTLCSRLADAQSGNVDSRRIWISARAADGTQTLRRKDQT